jgi:HlyD family secretion protein
VVAVIEPTDPSLLDPRTRAETEARVKAAEAALEAARAEAARDGEALELARHTHARIRELFQADSASQDDLDSAEHKLRMAEEEARRAGSAVHLSAFELEQVRAALLRTLPRDPADQSAWRFEVTSPITGRVLAIPRISRWRLTSCRPRL